MTDTPADPKDLQTARLLLALYRQGWRDAVAHLSVQSRVVDRQFKDMYSKLLPGEAP